MRGAVVAVRERGALARLALPRGRATASDAAVECALLDLVLDEADGGVDAAADSPGDLRLHRDREVAPDVLEEGLVGLREVVRILGQTLHRALAGGEHVAPVLQLRLGIDIRIDQILDRA